MQNPVANNLGELPPIRTVEEHISRITYRLMRDEEMTTQEQIETREMMHEENRKHWKHMTWIAGGSILFMMASWFAFLHIA